MKNFLPAANNFLSRNVHWVTLSSIPLGFSTDIFNYVSGEFLACVLFVELFIACFKIRFEEVKEIKYASVVGFFLARFVIFPILLFLLLQSFSQPLAIAVLLLALAPAGVTSPAFTGLVNGNVSLTIIIVLISSLLAPFYLPYILSFFIGTDIQIDILALLKTIAIIVIVPLVMHIPFRKSNHFKSFMIDNNPILILPMVVFCYTVPFSKNREFLFLEPVKAVGIIIFCMLFYLLASGVGRFAGRTNGESCQKSYLVTAVMHNITLITVLAIMHLPKEVSSIINFANVAVCMIVAFIIYRINKKSGAQMSDR